MYRLPGYPFVIGTIGNISNNWIPPLLILQVLVDLAVVYLLWKSLKRFGSFRYIPVIVYLMHPYTITFSMYITPASLTGLFVMSTFYFETRQKLSIYIKSILIGLMISLGILFRPMLMYAGVMYGAYYFIRWIFDRKFKYLISIVIVIAFSNVATLSMRYHNANNLAFDEVSSESGNELVRRLLRQSGEMTINEARIWARDTQIRFTDSLGVVDYTARDSVFSSEIKRLILQHPLPIIGEHLFMWLRLFTPEQKYLAPNDFYLASPVILRILSYIFVAVSFLFLLSGMVLGTFMRTNDRNRELSILGLLWFQYFAVIHAKLAYSYYAVPFMGVWIAAGYIGWSSYLNRNNGRFPRMEDFLRKIANLSLF